MEKNLNNESEQRQQEMLVMPRFFVDKRVGCIAIRDSHHPEFNKEHQGLDSELPCIVKFKMGEYVNNEWNLSNQIIEQFILECNYLNSV
jgi:hypothetical protein